MADVPERSTAEAAYKDVEREALGRTQAQDHPKAILLGGQPGSGKSLLNNNALREFNGRGGAVVIDADQMREENPLYKRLSREDPLHAADRTQKEAGEWAGRLTAAAVENRRNLVVDGTMRNPENMRNLAVRLKENGYEVEARVMAVSSDLSMMRARLRFEDQFAERGTGRAVTRGQHDEAYAGLVRSVGSLEREKLIDSVRLYDHRQQPIYDNQLKDGVWQRAPNVERALEQERGRQWTHAERKEYVSLLEEISRQGNQRESSQRLPFSDREEILNKLEAARADLANFERSPTYHRAHAFDQLEKKEALMRHPELDGAYKNLQELKQQWGPEMPQEARQQSYLNARASISEQLHRGNVPQGNVTLDESKRVLELAASHRGLIVRDGGDHLKQDIKGEVVALSSHHALVKMSEMVAVRYEKAGLDRDMHVGERVTVQHGNDKNHVYEQGKEPARDSRDMGHDMNRHHEITR